MNIKFDSFLKAKVFMKSIIHKSEFFFKYVCVHD